MISSITTPNGNITLSDYHAVCKGKNLQECTFDVTKFNAVAALSPRYLRTKASPYILKLDFIVDGDSKESIFKDMMRLEHALYVCDIVLTSEPSFIHSCVLKDTTHKFYGNKAVLTITYDDIITSAKTTINITQSGATFDVVGARDTYIGLKITAITALNNYIINNIMIKTLSAGYTMFIDGDNATVTVGDQNRINDVVMYEFPTAKGKYSVTADLSQANIQAFYYPRW